MKWTPDTDHTFQYIFLIENIRISLKLVPEIPTENKSALVQAMAWHHTCKKTLPESMMPYDIARS